jgi:hypothetical protein
MRLEKWSRFGCEVAVTLAIGAGFVAVGLAWTVTESALRHRDEVCVPIAYAGSPMACDEPTIWLVDGYNVLHATVHTEEAPASFPQKISWPAARFSCATPC